MVSVKKPRRPPGFFAERVIMPKSPYLHDHIANEINSACNALRKSPKGVEALDRQNQMEACRWFVEAMYQAFCCLPHLPLALYRRRNQYHRLPFGYDIISRVLEAAEQQKMIRIMLGKYSESGEAYISRVKPTGAMLSHFNDLGLVWQKIPPPRPEDCVLITTDKKNKKRRIATLKDHQSVAEMRQNLRIINEFLSKQCIYINLADDQFSKPESKFIKVNEYDKDDKPSVNFQSVFLRRLFTADGVSPIGEHQGGRFYHGWWQCIRSELRPFILINGSMTAECDFSGMALSCLYAREGITIGSQDPYDIGINYKPGDPRRKSVKQFVSALLNDTANRFRLSNSELAALGLSHAQLLKVIKNRHSKISHHFGTGIGLHLQYLDSKVAEKVMLRFVEINEVCLPIHDSFVVKANLLPRLESIMKEEFENEFRATIGTKTTINWQSGSTFTFIKSNPATVTGEIDEKLNATLTLLYQTHSYCIRYPQSWERQTFTDEEIANRIRDQNIRFDLARHK